jgi:hypothetical protein
MAASARREVLCLTGKGNWAGRKELRGKKTDASACRRKPQRVVVAVDSTKRSNGSARPDKTGADRNGPGCGSKSAGVEGGAMDSKQRNSGKPSSALDRHTECRR